MELPPDVHVLVTAAGMHIQLPQRERTSSRWASLIPMLFGLPFAGFGIGWISSLWWTLGSRGPDVPGPEVGPELSTAPVPLTGPSPSDILSAIVMSLFGLPFLAIGLFILGIGILSLFPSHSEIVLSSDHLTALERIGPFRFRRRRPLADIAGLRLGTVFEKSNASTNHGIFAELQPRPGIRSKPLRLAPRYPKELLLPVAEFLRSELKNRGNLPLLHAGPATATEAIPLTIDPEPVPDVTPLSLDLPAIDESPPPQPPKSKIQFLPAPDTLTFLIPRTGFRGAALVFLWFSLFWDGLSYTFFGVVLVRWIREPTLENLGIVGFLSIFVAIGTATLLGSIQLAFRRSVLLATRESLVLTQTGPLRKSEFQWTAAELAAIRCANSNTSVNNQPLKELQVQSTNPRRPTKRGLLEGRDETELAWLAATLRSFYKVRS